MKKTIQLKVKRDKAVILGFFLMFISIVSIGQGYSRLEQSETVTINKKSSATNMIISVPDNYNYLSFKIKGSLDQGTVFIQVVDPSGQVKKDLSFTTGLKADNAEPIQGKMRIGFRNPDKGTWQVHIIPKNADANIRVISTLISNPRADLLELEEIEEETNEHFN